MEAALIGLNVPVSVTEKTCVCLCVYVCAQLRVKTEANRKWRDKIWVRVEHRDIRLLKRHIISMSHVSKARQNSRTPLHIPNCCPEIVFLGHLLHSRTLDNQHHGSEYPTRVSNRRWSLFCMQPNSLLTCNAFTSYVLMRIYPCFTFLILEERHTVKIGILCYTNISETHWLYAIIIIVGHKEGRERLCDGFTTFFVFHVDSEKVDGPWHQAMQIRLLFSPWSWPWSWNGSPQPVSPLISAAVSPCLTGK